MSEILLLLEIPQFCRALTAAPLIAVTAALLGVFLVLGNMSMIGDGLSHVGLGSAAVALAVGVAPLWMAVPAVLVASLLLLIPDRFKHTAAGNDSLIGAVAGGTLAVGISVISICKGINADIDGYLFGSLLTMTDAEYFLCIAAAVSVILFFLFAGNTVMAITFDSVFASASGVRMRGVRAVIACLVAVTSVVAMKAVGALLITGLTVFPVLSALKICRSFRGTLTASAAFAAVGAFTGFATAAWISLPPGATVICAGIIIYIICSAAASVSGHKSGR